MISYQAYRLLNESFFTLGVKSPNVVGIAGSNLQEAPMDAMPMDDEMGMGEEMPMDDEMGDEMGAEDEMGEMEPCFVCNQAGEEMGEDPNCEACGGTGWIPAEESEMGDEEMEAPMMGDEMGDEMGGDKEMVFMKKPMRKHMPIEDDEERFAQDMEDAIHRGQDHDRYRSDDSHYRDMHDDSHHQHDDRRKGVAAGRYHPDKQYMSKGGCCNKYMKKEDADFMSSLMNQITGDTKKNHSSGLKEDVLFAMEQPKEPQPGEVGFAPQGRVGGNLGTGFTADDIDLPTLGD